MDDFKDLIEEVFEGPNERLIQVRISPSMYEGLQKEEQEAGISIPDLLRAFIGTALLPNQLCRVAEMEDVRGLDQARRYLVEVSNLRKASSSAASVLRQKEKAMRNIIKLAEAKADAFLDRELGKMRLLAEQHEREAKLRKKQQQAAGIRGPDSPSKLNEAELNALTDLQKKQRRFLKD
jgi:hypothetical protein